MLPLSLGCMPLVSAAEFVTPTNGSDQGFYKVAAAETKHYLEAGTEALNKRN